MTDQTNTKQRKRNRRKAPIADHLRNVEFIWFDKSDAEICAQLKDPKRNGGRDIVGTCGMMHR